LGGKQDAVVFKLDPTLSNLVWSSYLGGSENDAGYSLTITDSLHVYATGGTFSTDFPVTTGCYNTSYNGGEADGYIAKINPSGNAIVKATYVGTNLYDQSYFVETDNSGNVYVFGQSEGNMPVVGPVYSNANSHQFVSKLDNQLTNLNRSTVIGSSQASIDISPSAFMVDYCGNIYLSGWGGNITNTLLLSGMPVTGNALYSSAPNGFDFYFMQLSANMSALMYGSYFGGNCSNEHVDGGTSRFDKSGRLYQSMCAGCGGNDDFPVSTGAWPSAITAFPPGPNLSSNCNNGLAKLDFQPNICVASISNTLTGNFCPTVTTTFLNTSTNFNVNHWIISPGNFTTTSLNATHTFTAAGNYTVKLVVTNTTTCNMSDSTVIFLTVPTCTSTVGMKQNQVISNDINIFPNPTKGVFTLNMTIFSIDSEIEIYNSLGQSLLSKKINSNVTPLDLTKYPNGLYFIKVREAEKEQTLKLIKE
jgi:PKD repeat protein